MKLAFALATVILAASPAVALAQTMAPPVLAPDVAPPPPPQPSPEAAKTAKAALRTVIDQLRAGTPDFDKMSPQLSGLLQPHTAEVKTILEGLGPMTALDLIGINPDDQVIYFKATFKNGVTAWAIKVEADGKLSALALKHIPG